MWSCATIDNARAQRFNVTVARLTFTDWRSAFRQRHVKLPLRFGFSGAQPEIFAGQGRFCEIKALQ